MTSEEAMAIIVARVRVNRRAQASMRAGHPFMTTGQFSRGQLIDIIDREDNQLAWTLGLLLLPAGATDEARYEAGLDYLRGESA